MPKLKLPNGKILKYTAVPLFPGVKQINKDIAAENLHLVKKILDSNEIPFQLAFGTLLGAIREHDFITHDEDIDLAILDEYRTKFLSVIPQMMETGFRVCRYDRRDLLSIMRNGEYIDFYFFRPYEPDNQFVYSSGCIGYMSIYTQSIPYTFKGEEYMIPQEYIKFLRISYGDNWQTPVVYFPYNMSRWARLKFLIKEKIKDILPDFIYFPLAKLSEKKMLKKELMRIEIYLNREKEKQQ